MTKDYDSAVTKIYDMIDNGVMTSDDVMEFFLSYSNQSVEVLQEIIDIFDSGFDAVENEDLDSDSEFIEGDDERCDSHD